MRVGIFVAFLPCQGSNCKIRSKIFLQYLNFSWFTNWLKKFSWQIWKWLCPSRIFNTRHFGLVNRWGKINVVFQRNFFEQFLVLLVWNFCGSRKNEIEKLDGVFVEKSQFLDWVFSANQVIVSANWKLSDGRTSPPIFLKRFKNVQFETEKSFDNKKNLWKKSYQTRKKSMLFLEKTIPASYMFFLKFRRRKNSR